MKLFDRLNDANWDGRTMTPIEQTLILGYLDVDFTKWLCALSSTKKLIGSTFSLSEDHDLSGLGVELRWMSGDEMLDEITSFHPGIKAIKAGYFPFGLCLEGSGDPYFLKIADEPKDSCVVRISHEGPIDEQLDQSSIDLVSSNLGTFFEHVTCHKS